MRRLTTAFFIINYKLHTYLPALCKALVYTLVLLIKVMDTHISFRVNLNCISNLNLEELGILYVLQGYKVPKKTSFTIVQHGKLKT